MAQRGRPRHPGLLTQREEEVLALLREGLTNEQIADRLGIGFETAKHHVSQILSKLDVTTREEAAAWQPEREPSRWSPARIALALGGTAVFAAAVAGLALLTWGVSESGESADKLTQNATQYRFNTNLNGEIMIIHADGNGLTSLGYGSHPTWSPDGSQIAFLHAAENYGLAGTTDVMVMNSDGTDVRRLTSYDWTDVVACVVFGIGWSDDGEAVVYQNPSGAAYTVDVDTSQQSRLETPCSTELDQANTGTARSTASYSPDGQMATYSNLLTEVVFLTPADDLNAGSELVRGIFPHWSPIDDRIVFEDVSRWR